MNVYWFEVELAAPVTEDQIEDLGGVLESGAGIDATVQASEHGGTIMFSREADDAVQAITSAVRDVEAAGMQVCGVTEDRVTVAEIAERAGVSVASVRYWIAGERGPGGFPVAKVPRSRASLYSWADVAAWLARAKLGQVDHVAAECAQACAIIDAALTVRSGLRELPARSRPLVSGLVA
jgi:predicted transcriptional regulator